jgi:hypothetical protein
MPELGCRCLLEELKTQLVELISRRLDPVSIELLEHAAEDVEVERVGQAAFLVLVGKEAVPQQTLHTSSEVEHNLLLGRVNGGPEHLMKNGSEEFVRDVPAPSSRRLNRRKGDTIDVSQAAALLGRRPDLRPNRIG